MMFAVHHPIHRVAENSDIVRIAETKDYHLILGR